MAGQPEKALDVLEQLLAKPSSYSSGWLRIDPTWAALRGNSRFALRRTWMGGRVVEGTGLENRTGLLR